MGTVAEGLTVRASASAQCGEYLAVQVYWIRPVFRGLDLYSVLDRRGCRFYLNKGGHRFDVLSVEGLRPGVMLPFLLPLLLPFQCRILSILVRPVHIPLEGRLL